MIATVGYVSLNERNKRLVLVLRRVWLPATLMRMNVKTSKGIENNSM